jgi:DnaJ-class molecular chaperone
MEKQMEEKKDCLSCKGSGVITKQYIFSEEWPMDCGFHENDCEDCNGSGEEQSE